MGAMGRALDVLFGLVFVGLGVYLFAQRHERVAVARERGTGITSMRWHTLLALLLVAVGVWGIATAFV
jgi:hypothetical protein